MRANITDRLCGAAKPGTYHDAKLSGLELRVSGKGTRTWYLLYTAPNGKRARTKLGRYPQTSLAEARTRALEALSNLDEGYDPRDIGAGSMTVSVLFERYLVRHVIPKLRSAKAVERRLRKNVIPIIGGIGLGALHRRDITRAIDQIIDRGAPVEAQRVFDDVRGMLRWAVERGDLDHNPSDGMRAPEGSEPRKRALSDAEIKQLWDALPGPLPSRIATILKLCLITGQRVGEVAGMRRSEIDLEKRLWVIPAERTKNRHEHTVPLSGMAISILKGIGGDPLFDAHTLTVSRWVNRAQKAFGLEPWSAHDLRRTVITHLAELGVAPIVAGHVANHRSTTKAGVTLAVYSQHTYEPEKRQALELWADRLQAIISGMGAVIVPLRA